MADVADIEQVRQNTGEVDSQDYSDIDISAMIDLLGVRGASHRIWTQKAAKYAGLVDVTEGSSRRAMSDLHKNALNMSKFYDGPEGGGAAGGGIGGARVHKIQRS